MSPWSKKKVHTDIKAIHNSVSVEDPRDWLPYHSSFVTRECLSDMGILEYTIRSAFTYFVC